MAELLEGKYIDSEWVEFERPGSEQAQAGRFRNSMFGNEQGKTLTAVCTNSRRFDYE